MFNVGNFVNNEALYYLRNYGLIAIIGIICSTMIMKKFLNKLDKSNKMVVKIIEVLFYIGILVLCTASLVTDTFNPFLYFRF